MISAQLLRVRETWPQDVWARTGRVQLASAFLATLVAGKWTSMGESEACATVPGFTVPVITRQDTGMKMFLILLEAVKKKAGEYVAGLAM